MGDGDRVRGLFVGVVVAIAIVCAACSSGGSPSTAAPPSTVPAARCAAYRALSALDLRIANEESSGVAKDWRRLRADLAAAFITNHKLYGDVAENASGSLQVDAQTVSDFMPKSHAVLLASRSLAEYRAMVSRVPGDAAVRAAATHVNTDAAASCRVQMIHAPRPTTP